MSSFLTHLHSLLTHGAWADARLLAAARAADVPVPEVLRELAHVRGAQEIWLSRIEQRAPVLAQWPNFTIDDLAQAGAMVDAAWQAFFAHVDPASLEHGVAYANSTGQSFSTPLGEILLHLLTHGQYHRGKANAALQSAGATPVGVDYIVWYREQASAAG